MCSTVPNTEVTYTSQLHLPSQHNSDVWALGAGERCLEHLGGSAALHDLGGAATTRWRQQHLVRVFAEEA